MSLIPYQPHEGREIVLRHQNAIVVRDSTSHRLEIRGLTECPTCHQPLTRAPPAPERPHERPFSAREDSYVDPDYFRMLRAVSADSAHDGPPSSPIRRLFKPALAGSSSSSAPDSQAIPPADGATSSAEFVSGTPGLTQAEGSRIRRDAFSPNYFNTFFVEEKVLGKGGKGVVLLVRHEIDGCHLGHFACKRVPVGDDHEWLEKVLIEVELLAKLSHPNLVSYRHVWLEDVSLNRFGPSVACAFILQQFCNGGDLHQYIIGSGPREASKEELKAQMRRRSKGQMELPRDLYSGGRHLSFDEIFSLFRDITSGVAYLHAANYIHRDLKPSNCLLHREGGRLICLISDFGEVQPENSVRKSSGTTGTISYCAPEVLKLEASGRYGNFTTKSDIFSLGMILYFMCFGRLPYRNANSLQEELEDVDELRAEIMTWSGFQDERRERPDLPSKLYLLLQKMLSISPTERPSASEVLRAMRGESMAFDGREERPATPPSLSIAGARVENLDSPAPGTPALDTRKQPILNNSKRLHEYGHWRRPSTQRDISPAPDAHATGQDHAQSRGVSRHRTSHSMAITRSQTGSRQPSANPESHEEAIVLDEDNVTRPPLLMPPSRYAPGTWRHKLEIRMAQFVAIAGPWFPMLGLATRFAFFSLKLWSVGRPCWPFMANPQISIPLVAAAALDLCLPNLSPASHLPGARFAGLPHTWGVETSIALLVLHFAVLWMAVRWETLCPASHLESWAYW